MIALVKPKIKCIITQYEKRLATTSNDTKAAGSRGEAIMLSISHNFAYHAHKIYLIMPDIMLVAFQKLIYTTN